MRACPLCSSEQSRNFFSGKKRSYHQCVDCCLVFVPPNQFLPEEDEKKRYDLHQNRPDDPGYRSFLQRLFDPLQACLRPGSSGLDFGSGPGPVLSLLFEQAGHSMTLFDRYYKPDYAVLGRQYDFITAAEVVEHLRRPGQELDRLWSCLKQGGVLGIMTKFVASQAAFSLWRYKDDPTHIHFFAPETFEVLALRWDARLTFADTDVVLFQKTKKKIESETDFRLP